MGLTEKVRLPWMPLFLIIFAVSVWCIAQALGTYLAGGDIRRPLVVLAVSLLFLGSWSVLLLLRYRRTH